MIFLYKKSKNNPLTDEQKSANKQFGCERIFIEHSISGLKYFRILSDRFRVHDIDLYDSILRICAGLRGFYLTTNKLFFIVKTSLIFFLNNCN